MAKDLRGQIAMKQAAASAAMGTRISYNDDAIDANCATPATDGLWFPKVNLQVAFRGFELSAPAKE